MEYAVYAEEQDQSGFVRIFGYRTCLSVAELLEVLNERNDVALVREVQPGMDIAQFVRIELN